MARNRKKNRRSGNGMTIPMAVVAGFMPLAVNVVSVSGGGLRRMGWMAAQALTGYDTDTQRFWYPNMWKGTFPIIIGIIVHSIASKLGVNRALGKAGIPFIRI